MRGRSTRLIRSQQPLSLQTQLQTQKAPIAEHAVALLQRAVGGFEELYHGRAPHPKESRILTIDWDKSYIRRYGIAVLSRNVYRSRNAGLFPKSGRSVERR